jgi:6-phosphogluconate dehydrogenase
MRIWRVGCIIQCNHIADMLEPILDSSSRAESSHKIMNMKLIPEVSDAVHRNFTPLKQIVSKSVQWDVYVATLSTSLEYLKYWRWDNASNEVYGGGDGLLWIP